MGVGFGAKGSHLNADRRFDETDLWRLYAVNPIITWRSLTRRSPRQTGHEPSRFFGDDELIDEALFL
jgi:hypothetical protein